MSRLNTLIRLHRWQLDERRRRVVDLEVLRESAAARLQALDEATAAEARRAESDLVVRAAYPAFRASIDIQRRKLLQTMDTLAQEIAEAQEAVAAAFQELKRYELAEEARQKRERATRDRREAMLLDEMALETFRRADASSA